MALRLRTAEALTPGGFGPLRTIFHAQSTADRMGGLNKSLLRSAVVSFVGSTHESGDFIGSLGGRTKSTYSDRAHT